MLIKIEEEKLREVLYKNDFTEFIGHAVRVDYDKMIEKIKSASTTEPTKTKGDQIAEAIYVKMPRVWLKSLQSYLLWIQESEADKGKRMVLYGFITCLDSLLKDE